MGADMTDKTIAVWRADDEADLAAHYAIRHRVFTNEQGVLLFTDLDQGSDVVRLEEHEGEKVGALRLPSPEPSGEEAK